MVQTTLSIQHNALISATGWIQQVMLGSVAVGLAIIAVASIGLLMLTGRMDLRRSGAVIVGCFIIFGASIIATGLTSTARAVATGQDTAPAIAASPLTSPNPPAYPQGPPQPFDPYAGAALPSN